MKGIYLEEYLKPMNCKWTDGELYCTDPITTKIAEAIICRSYTIKIGPLEFSTEPRSSRCGGMTMRRKAKGRVNLDETGRIIGAGGIAATLHGHILVTIHNENP